MRTMYLALLTFACAFGGASSADYVRVDHYHPHTFGEELRRMC